MSTSCRWFPYFLLFMVIIAGCTTCQPSGTRASLITYPSSESTQSPSLTSPTSTPTPPSPATGTSVSLSITPTKSFPSPTTSLSPRSCTNPGPSTSSTPEFTSDTRIPRFNQFARNRTFVDAAFASRDDYVDRGALGDINVDGTPGTITFNVMLVAGFKFEDARSGRVVDDESDSLKVWWEGLVVSLSPSNSSASGSGKLVKPEDCEVS